MRINSINSTSFGKLYINKTDENRLNLRLFEHKGDHIIDMYDAFSKIDCATGDVPVVLNLFRAKIPQSNGKTKDGWQFVISDKVSGKTLSVSTVESGKEHNRTYKKALNKLVGDMNADKFQWCQKNIDALIEKFN